MPEGANVGQAVNEAMRAIEKENPDRADVLPKSYHTLPCTLWFFDKGKAGTGRADKVLFLDARHIFRQLDRAHRDFTRAQLEFLANVVRLYRCQPCEFHQGSEPKIRELFGNTSSNRKSSIANLQFQDIPGLCKAAILQKIEAQGWSLNPGSATDNDSKTSTDEGLTGSDFQI